MSKGVRGEDGRIQMNAPLAPGDRRTIHLAGFNDDLTSCNLLADNGQALLLHHQSASQP